MFHYEYKTRGTCSSLITLDLEGEIYRRLRWKSESDSPPGGRSDCQGCRG